MTPTISAGPSTCRACGELLVDDRAVLRHYAREEDFKVVQPVYALRTPLGWANHENPLDRLLYLREYFRLSSDEWKLRFQRKSFFLKDFGSPAVHTSQEWYLGVMEVVHDRCLLPRCGTSCDSAGLLDNASFERDRHGQEQCVHNWYVQAFSSNLINREQDEWFVSCCRFCNTFSNLVPLLSSKLSVQYKDRIADTVLQELMECLQMRNSIG